MKDGLRISALTVDIETSQMMFKGWKIHDTYVSPDSIVEDSYVIAYAAKFWGDKKVQYDDTSRHYHLKDEKNLLVYLHSLLAKAEFVITQNGKAFDLKVLNARFIKYGFPPLHSLKHIDTKVNSKKISRLTSNSLDYMGKYFNLKNQKDKHSKWPGTALWDGYMSGDRAAQRDMMKYNKRDVLATEELAGRQAPYVDPNSWSITNDLARCKCGHDKFQFNGPQITDSRMARKFRCMGCNKVISDVVYNKKFL